MTSGATLDTWTTTGDGLTANSSNASGNTSDEETTSPETLDLTGGALIAKRGREPKQMKAIRLLVQGRLRVLRVDSEFIAAECRGDSGVVYSLGWRDQRWTCSCPARTDCSHLNALWAVCAVSRR